MDLSAQQRDALLAGLSLLRCEIEHGRVVINKDDPECDPIGDLLSNGGEHDGLSAEEVSQLADLIVAEYPEPDVYVAAKQREI